MKTQVIIPAGGLGVRLKKTRPKPLVLLNGKPLVVYSLEVFGKMSLIDSIILVASREHITAFQNLVKKYKLKKIAKIIEGGKTRRDSVFSGLKNLDHDTDLVMIHDGARPLISRKLVEKCLSAGFKEEALIVAVPLKATVKRVNASTLIVDETMNRKILWEVQTPQVFKKDVILKAHREIQLYDPCDDALLVEKMGGRVKIIEGTRKNIKITTQEDIDIAKALLNSQKGSK